jgi:hypothetical protein
MAVLAYNEERYGLDRSNMIAFYPRNGAVKEEGMRPKRKAIEQAHMADHVLTTVSTVYADFRLAASRAVRKRHLFRVPSDPATKRAKPAGIDAAGPSPGGADTGTGTGTGEGAGTGTGTGAGSGSSHDIKATVFIGVHGNCGPKSSLLALPETKSGGADSDSDTEPCGGGAGDLSHAVASKRNMASMSKHSLKIIKSSGPEGVGHGVYTASDMPAGTNLPVKGVWFTDMQKLNTWLQQQHPLTAEAMSRKIVEVHFSAPPEGGKVTHYCVMTG